MALDTPVLFIIFKRPDKTRRVFEAIRQAQPRRLFIAGDAARPGVAGEAERVAQTRAIVAEVDWACDVETRYATANLGPGYGPATAITWAFEHVAEAIILEDDCLPHPDFFRYCQALLARYRDDPQMMMVSGTNQLGRYGDDRASYLYTRLPTGWGWATWRRAWDHYRHDIGHWQDAGVRDRIAAHLRDRALFASFAEHFDEALDDPPGYWDYQWVLAMFLQRGWSITPTVNLVGNIGFDTEGTRTRNAAHALANKPTAAIRWPLRGPAQRRVDPGFERRMMRRVYHLTPMARARQHVRHWLRPPYRRIRRTIRHYLNDVNAGGAR